MTGSHDRSWNNRGNRSTQDTVKALRKGSHGTRPIGLRGGILARFGQGKASWEDIKQAETSSIARAKRQNPDILKVVKGFKILGLYFDKKPIDFTPSKYYDDIF